MASAMIILIFFAEYFSFCVGDKLPLVSKPDPASSNSLPVHEKILKELSFPLRLTFIKDMMNSTSNRTAASNGGDSGSSRAVGLQSLLLPSRKQADMENDDNNMKMKLFRLMYETVRDSDLKVKRAELIKKSYVNSSSFEVGYLLGDVTDKFNIMTDISLTLKRLYRDWKPIEHINAYEQIANMGIEISQIVELIKSVEKKIHQEDGANTKQQDNTAGVQIPGFRK